MLINKILSILSLSLLIIEVNLIQPSVRTVSVLIVIYWICFIFCYMYRWSGPPFPSRLFMKRYSNECESYALLTRFWRLRCKRSSGPGRLTFSPRNKNPKERKSLSIKAWRKNRNRRHVIFLEGFERRVEIWQVRGEQIRENGREGKKNGCRW